MAKATLRNKISDEKRTACLLALPDEVLAHIASQLHDPGTLLVMALMS